MFRNKIIVNFNSQLGNQMFQYALYYHLKLNGANVLSDLRYFDLYPQHYSLDVFDICLKSATNIDIAKSRDEYRSFKDRVRRKIFGKRKSIYEEITKDSLRYNEDIFSVKRGYIDGYWQSEKYFKDIRKQLLDQFTFPLFKDIRNIKLKNDISNNISVSIHVRRGDYINGFPLLSADYYSQAISYFNSKYDDVYFYVFSNDMQWSKENLIAKNILFVDWNVGKESYNDMHLMSLCKHHIIANSSFSWWGAWLNTYNLKEVIAPKLWLYHQETPDIHCSNWIVL